MVNHVSDDYGWMKTNIEIRKKLAENLFHCHFPTVNLNWGQNSAFSVRSHGLIGFDTQRDAKYIKYLQM